MDWFWKKFTVTTFNQKAWLKPYTELNTKVRQTAKNNFKKDFQVNELCSFRRNYGKCQKT